SALPTSDAAPRDIAGTHAGSGVAWPGVREPFFAYAGNGESGGRSQLLAATGGGSAPLSFDPATGQLTIQENAGDHNVREAVAAGARHLHELHRTHDGNWRHPAPWRLAQRRGCGRYH